MRLSRASAYSSQISRNAGSASASLRSVAAAYIVFVVFPALGRDYQAAVLSGGFTGLSLGSTPTAIASMSAITRRYGPAPNAFVILPLVSAFFVDIVNVGAISLFLRL